LSAASPPTFCAALMVEPSMVSICSLAQAARCGVRASTIAGAYLTGVVWKACAPISMPM
jgi:hypothetical protein